MKGNINAIWLTNNGKLHPKVIPRLTALTHQANLNNFQIVLWTNKDQVNKYDIKTLVEQNILVQDYSKCSSSKFYSHFIAFFNRGIKGDKAAFALASDILRMSILELAADNQYYIYFDPNDITFPDFAKSLAQLDTLMANNSFGFSFYVNPLSNDMQVFHVRNDVLIAKKEVNSPFFHDYLKAYAVHLDATAEKYFKPRTDKEAQDLARQISNQTTTEFFQILLTAPLPIVKATFSPYFELFPLVNCLASFPYKRHIEDANTWLPSGLLLEEKEEIEKLELEHNSIDNPPFSTNLSNVIREALSIILEDLINFKPQLIFLSLNVSQALLNTLITNAVEKFGPPLGKSITLPARDKANNVLENSNLQTSLSLSPSFFHQAYKAYLIEQRHIVIRRYKRNTISNMDYKAFSLI